MQVGYDNEAMTEAAARMEQAAADMEFEPEEYDEYDED